MSYEFDVALSFAGEDRDFAEAIAKGLRASGVEVFYDNFHTATLWGKDLSVELQRIYRDASRHCIMLLSAPYLEKMWTNWERQQAISRLITEHGSEYLLPVRLDGFRDEVPALPGTISYLVVPRQTPEVVVNTFLEKVGKARPAAPANPPELAPAVPRPRRKVTDREKSRFLSESFERVVATLEQFGRHVHHEQPSFECEVERVTSRKVLFMLYQDDEQVAKFMIWRGGHFGSDGISFVQGRHIDVSNENTTNEMISLMEDAGELKLSPMGMLQLGTNLDPMTPPEVARYLWEAVVRHL